MNLSVKNSRIYSGVVIKLILCASVLSSSVLAKEFKGSLRPCTGGVINKKVLSEEKPVYPEEARKAFAEGIVNVMVFIDEDGKVYEARACTGHKLLRSVALDAAYKTRFPPTILAGKKVRVLGVLVFKFRLDEETGRLANFDSKATNQ